MNAQTQRLMLRGGAGDIEALLDVPSRPEGVPCIGTAIVAHPHPLFGGTMDNKVVQTLARAFVQCGWRVVRFNFRGVGKSAGSYDEGRSESRDLIDVVAQVAPDGPLALAGFSFGSYVTSLALQELAAHRNVLQLVLVGVAATRFQVAEIPQELHANTLVVHGELDETVPLSDVMQWARPQTLPVTVVPGVEHFFHGQLTVLRGLVVRHLSSGNAVHA